MKKSKEKKDIKINKSNDKDLSSTIKKIKSNEFKYTIILVVFFIGLLIVCTYQTLSINNSELLNNFTTTDNNLTSTSETVVLTKDHIMSDSKGEKSNSYLLDIENNTKENVNYKVKLVEDKEQEKNCGCSNSVISAEYINYKINDGEVKKANLNETGDIVLTTGSLKKTKKDNLKIKIWIDESITKEIDYHFHGNFVVEELG